MFSHGHMTLSEFLEPAVEKIWSEHKVQTNLWGASCWPVCQAHMSTTSSLPSNGRGLNPLMRPACFLYVLLRPIFDE